MDFIEKAKLRLAHWITHDEHHLEEYGAFMEQLQEAGKQESADHIREMIALTAKSTECLHKALDALNP